MASRQDQPKCGTCNHAYSFHKRWVRCAAFGCQCTRWRKTKPAEKATGKKAAAR